MGRPQIMAFLVELSFMAAFGPAATPTPTPDVPRFSEGEAIAVVKEWIGDKTYIRNPRLSCSYPLDESAILLGRDSVVWSESYLGNGAWSVSVRPKERLTTALEDVDYAKLAESNPDFLIFLVALEGGQWEVYEYTGRVASKRSSYVDLFCR